MSAGTDPYPHISPHTQPSQAGHSADRGGAGPDRSEDWTNPASTQGRVRPWTGRLREED